jgi:hypothetical protein
MLSWTWLSVLRGAAAAGFKRISSVQIIYVGASEYALLGADTKPEDDEAE